MDLRKVPTNGASLSDARGIGIVTFVSASFIIIDHVHSPMHTDCSCSSGWTSHHHGLAEQWPEETLVDSNI